MKYYCKNCGSIFHDEQANRKFIHLDIKCPRCSSVMIHYPDYETPEQFQKRTGQVYPDNGLVFVSFLGYWLVKDDKPKEGYLYHYDTVVIADPPVPPPDDWRPE